MPVAKASPSFFNALGGNSSTNSSTNKFFCTLVIAQATFFVICATHSRGAIGKPSRSRLS